MHISVVIPLYNKAAYICATLRSVTAQKRRPDEIIVVDDGSTDGGSNIAEGVLGVTVIRQPNGGASNARNVGIRTARGNLVALLDADDLWDQDHLALVEAAFDTHPDAGVVCTGYRRFTEAGPVSRHVGAAGILPSFYAAWARGSFTCTSSIVVRRSVLMNLDSLFPVGESLGEDQDVWFRLAEAAPVAHVAIASAQYRIDAENNSGAEPVLDVLPCYCRLGERLASGRVPAHEVMGARKLLASHLINVARARFAAGDIGGARALLWTRQAAGNPVYWLRSLLVVA